MKKIVIITQFFHPEKGYMENQLAKHQAKLGNEVLIITTTYTKLWNTHYKKLIASDKDYSTKSKVKLIRLKIFAQYSRRVFPLGLFLSLNKYNPDIIYINGVTLPMTFISSLYVYYKNLFSIKPRVLIDDHMVYVASRNKKSNIFYKFHKFFLSRFYLNICDKWIAVTNETKMFMIDKYFYKKNIPEIKVVPIGVDCTVFFKNLSLKKKWRSENQIKEKDKIILYTGKRDKYKNPAFLLNIFEKLNNENIKLIMIGDNVENYDNKIHQIINKKPNLRGKVILLSSIPFHKLNAVYNAADVAIWPFGSSLSMLDAMVTGCPVIASEMDVNMERLGNNRGYLFKPNDINDLCDKINIAFTRKEEERLLSIVWANKLSYSKISKIAFN